jgi:hypothetical protein
MKPPLAAERQVVRRHLLRVVATIRRDCDEVHRLPCALRCVTIHIWFYLEHLQSRPRLKVDLIPGVNDSGRKVQHGVFIVVRNVSSHDVYLAGIDLL